MNDTYGASYFSPPPPPNKASILANDPPTPDYYLALLRELYAANRQMVHSCEQSRDEKRGMYYRGKLDAIAEAMNHYEELKK